MSASVHPEVQMVLAGEDSGKAGPLGLLVVVLLGIACYFLFKSMSGHLRKVQNGFDATTDAWPATPPIASPTGPAGGVDAPRTAAHVDATITGTNSATTDSADPDARSVPKRAK